jgi:Co/Zn/Cd efflux system component
MRRVFSYVLSLFGLFVMALSVVSIFFGTPQVDTAIAIGMAAFGLILCMVGFFIFSAGGSADGTV